jgi:hypothetical protein
MTETGNGVLPGAKGTVVVTTSAGVGVAAGNSDFGTVALEDVVLTIAHRLRGQELVNGVAGFLGPRPNGGEHVALDLDLLVAQGGVVEGAENVVNKFVYGDTRVLPGVDHAADSC